MTAFEHTELKGITLRLMWAMIVGTVIGVTTVCGAWFGFKSTISEQWAREDKRYSIDSVNRVHDEIDILALKQDVEQLKFNTKQFKNEKISLFPGAYSADGRSLFVRNRPQN